MYCINGNYLIVNIPNLCQNYSLDFLTKQNLMMSLNINLNIFSSFQSTALRWPDVIIKFAKNRNNLMIHMALLMQFFDDFAFRMKFFKTFVPKNFYYVTALPGCRNRNYFFHSIVGVIKSQYVLPNQAALAMSQNNYTVQLLFIY